MTEFSGTREWRELFKQRKEYSAMVPWFCPSTIASGYLPIVALLVTHAVVAIQRQLSGRGIELIGSQAAVEHIVFAVHFHIFSFVPALQQAAKDQHHYAVANHQNVFLPVVAGQHPQKAVNAQCHVRTALAARRTVPVLAFALAPGKLLGVTRPNSGRGKTI